MSLERGSSILVIRPGYITMALIYHSVSGSESSAAMNIGILAVLCKCQARVSMKMPAGISGSGKLCPQFRDRPWSSDNIS